jgi:large subunit ribosomal protein L3
MFGFVKKIGMTRLFLDQKSVAVTAVQFEDQKVVQRKTIQKDGYQAFQVGYGSKRKRKQPISGHIKKHLKEEDYFSKISEFKSDIPEDKTDFTINDFQKNDSVTLVGITKGKGFAGAVKRYHFRGQPKSRGHDHVRAVGSIGSRWPQRTLPGKKMAGQMGNEQRTLQNLVIVDIDVEKKLIYIKGSVTGANKSLLKIAKTIKHVS